MVKLFPKQLEVTNKNGYQPLHLVAWYGDNESVAALLDAGAEIDARGNHDRTALYLAAENNQPHTVKACTYMHEHM